MMLAMVVVAVLLLLGWLESRHSRKKQQACRGMKEVMQDMLELVWGGSPRTRLHAYCLVLQAACWVWER